MPNAKIAPNFVKQKKKELILFVYFLLLLLFYKRAINYYLEVFIELFSLLLILVKVTSNIIENYKLNKWKKVHNLNIQVNYKF